MMAQVWNKRMLIMLFLGFSSGLPLALTFGTLQAWMKESGINLTLLGAVTMIGIPYNLKFLWSPVFDRFVPPILGRRRGWMVILQVALMIAVLLMSQSDPSRSIGIIVGLAVLVAFLSASYDIVVDAFRREYLATEELAPGTGIFVNGYRVGMLISGAGALRLADDYSWSGVYLIMGACCLIGILTTLFCKEPSIEHEAPKSLQEAVVLPFLDYFKRGATAWWILAFVLLYKLGDNLASAISMPLYLDVGFTKTTISYVAKVFGFAAVFGGGFVGGWMVPKWGLVASLWVFGILQALGAMAFGLLPMTGPKTEMLIFVIALENFAVGMGTTGLLSFMGLITSKRFTATQFALLSSLFALPRTLISAPSGWLAENMGYSMYFIFCGLMAIPGLLLILKIKNLPEIQSTKAS